MAASGKDPSTAPELSYLAGKEEKLLFWMKLLALFLFLNLVLYGLQLAGSVSGCALTAPVERAPLPTTADLTTETRVIKALAVADGWYQLAQPQWEETVRRAIADISHLYQQRFGITFELVGIRAWDTPHTFTMPNELAALKRAYPITNEYDVVIGLTSGSGLVVAGISEILGNHLLVAATPFHSLTGLLAHELGHIFGVRDTGAMALTQLLAGPLAPTTLPGSFAAAIREQKWRPFRLPPVSTTMAQAER
ncbi:MAG TPA: zinc-dependent metalloprotease family protein [Methylomirabilota bacterium]|jgi:Zn-dependent protease with chaperone function|nr:zinc-dependent metalloprotease family protein [Methylomirabilota bacterium]